MGNSQVCCLQGCAFASNTWRVCLGRTFQQRSHHKCISSATLEIPFDCRNKLQPNTSVLNTSSKIHSCPWCVSGYNLQKKRPLAQQRTELLPVFSNLMKLVTFASGFLYQYVIAILNFIICSNFENILLKI